MKKIGLISFAIFFITAGKTIEGAWWWPPETITIVPQTPTSSDVVVITLSGWWPDSCVPNGSAISVSGNDIYFDVIHNYPPDIICLTVITPWEQTQSVGPLSPGTYKVYARLIGDPYVPSIYTLMTEFTVTDRQFVLSTDSLTISEGQTATFTVALMIDPCETIEVTVAHKSGDPDITIQSGGRLTFDSSNYSVPQTVTLAASEDEDYLNGTTVFSISAPNYLTAELTATEADNDTPSVLYVDSNANGSNDGRSWADAFTNLQEALSIAAAYYKVKEIHVAQGTYKPAGPSGKRNATFQLITGVSLKGGYAGYSEPNPDAHDIDTNKTILSGDLNGDDGPNFTKRDNNSFHVVTGSGTDSMAVLDGFTITAGDGAVGGGGMLCYDGDPTIRNCTFNGNRSNYGGGIRCYNSSLTITNCIFNGNGSLGGKIDDGGAIFIQGNSRPTLINCTFVDNWTVETGGGLCCNYPSIAKVTNCIFWGNRDGGGTDESAQIHGGNLVVNYCCIQGWTGALGGIGNIGANPLFADPNKADYHLKSQAGRWDANSGSWVKDDVTSPCIDAGDPASPISLEPFPNGGIINMGVYGGTGEASKSYFSKPVCEIIVAGDVNGDCKVDFKDFALMAFHWLEER